MPPPANTSASFYVPRPSTPITIESFDIPADAFRARFQLSHHAIGILTGTRLLAMAFDAGYGAPTDQTKLLRFSPDIQKQLHSYQKARWKYLNTLLEIAPATGEVLTRFVVKHIESTEKGDAAFILGCLGSRYATEEWLSHRNQKLHRFWHFSVYSNPAVSISLSSSDSRPDYISQAFSSAGTANGHWYALEAKGTLGTESWGRLQTGLGQARLLKTVAYTDYSGNEIVAAIDDHAVSLACFHKRRLHVVHVDPPAFKEPNTDSEENNIGLMFNTDMVQLLHVYQGYQQFKSMTRPAKSFDIPFTTNTEVYFGELILNTRKGGRVRIAIPSFLYKSAGLISDVLIALSSVTPAVAAYYRDFSSRPRNETEIDAWNLWLRDQLLADHHDGAASARSSLIRRRMWKSLHISGATASQYVPRTALEALNRIANATIVSGPLARNEMFASIEQIRAKLDAGILGLKTARMELDLAAIAPKETDPVPKINFSYVTLQGLLIIRSNQ